MHHRKLIVLEGDRVATASQAWGLRSPDLEEFLWVGSDAPPGVESVPLHGVKRLLGRSFDLVVLDFHDVLDANVLGQCHGFVWGGGALVVRMGNSPGQPNLAVFPFTPADVTDLMFTRIRHILGAARVDPQPLHPVTHPAEGTAEQTTVVEALQEICATPDLAVLTADRGRGKSSALGLALRGFAGRAIVTAASEDAVREVLTFAADADVRFVATPELPAFAGPADLVLVDEAAQLPVALLHRIVDHFEHTPIVFATTTHGYEGTGRGFVLRFVERLKSEGRRPLHHLSLNEPVRWAAGDPLERAVFEALLLDAEPEEPPASIGTLWHRRVEPAELAGNERLLRQIFGLLVHAHYRTTPSDLHRMLDAPNLSVHASFAGEVAVAATLVAAEGGLPPELAVSLSRGERRMVGQALPETFASHLGMAQAAELTMIRSVRIATHAKMRRKGVASELVQHVHDFYAPDLFGTLFGATPELLRFRRSVGYEVVRLSASRAPQTGVPSVAMIRPVSERASDLLRTLRPELARDLPVQLELMQAGGELRLDPALVAELCEGLGNPAALTPERRLDLVREYAFGPRTFESVALAVAQYVESCPALGSLPAADRALVEARVLQRTSWHAAASAAGVPGVPAAMRGLRRAVRTLIAG